jgi:hypothetical protein
MLGIYLREIPVMINLMPYTIIDIPNTKPPNNLPNNGDVNHNRRSN